MRAKHIYNKNAREKALLEEAYSQVNEGHSGPVPGWEKQAGLEKELEANRKAARRDPHRHVGAEDRRRAPSEVWKSMPPGERDKLGPDRSEEQETHKPYVSSYMPFHRDEDDKLKPSKKIWAVLDQDGNAIFTSNDKDEAYKWFADNFKDLRDDDAPLPDHPADNAWPLGRAAALRKEPGTDKDKLFYK